MQCQKIVVDCLPSSFDSMKAIKKINNHDVCQGSISFSLRYHHIRNLASQGVDKMAEISGNLVSLKDTSMTVYSRDLLVLPGFLCQ